MLTISAISSVCVFIKSKILKQVRFNNILLNLLPSIYESENISIKFLFFTMFFLTYLYLVDFIITFLSTIILIIFLIIK